MQQSTVIEMIYLPITITNAFKWKVVSLQLFHLIREGEMFLEIKNILTSQGTIDAISNILNKIPKYISHYSFSNRVYFQLTLSWKKLYEVFCKQNTDLQVDYKLLKSEADKYNVKI